jgi:hypothetical protein
MGHMMTRQGVIQHSSTLSRICTRRFACIKYQFSLCISLCMHICWSTFVWPNVGGCVYESPHTHTRLDISLLVAFCWIIAPSVLPVIYQSIFNAILCFLWFFFVEYELKIHNHCI